MAKTKPIKKATENPLKRDAESPGKLAGNKLTRSDLLLEVFNGQLAGGSLSELANYSDLFHRMKEIVFLVDPTSKRILDYNESAQKLLGREESEILGVPITHFFPLAHEARYEGSVTNSQGQTVEVEVQQETVKIQDYFEVTQILLTDISQTKKLLREVEQANQILKALSSKDEMTGLPNFRTFKETLKVVHEQATQQNTNYGVIFMDVDHFKKINDTHGHPAGDAILKQVAFTLGQCNSDQLVARYGGEEFVVLVQGESVDAMALRAERTRAALNAIQTPFAATQPLKIISASMGIAVFPIDGKTSAEILEAADQAVYRAKNGGRNRVERASSVSSAPQKIKKTA